MWDSLCQHFDNVTLSVSSALNEIRDFRYAHEEDYQGVVRLIRQVESICQQLEMLHQVKLVSNREVSLMVSFFPPLLRKDWAECYFKLDTDKQLTPFESLHDFFKDQLKINKWLTCNYLWNPNINSTNHSHKVPNLSAQMSKSRNLGVRLNVAYMGLGTPLMCASSLQL